MADGVQVRKLGQPLTAVTAGVGDSVVSRSWNKLRMSRHGDSILTLSIAKVPVFPVAGGTRTKFGLDEEPLCVGRGGSGRLVLILSSNLDRSELSALAMSEPERSRLQGNSSSVSSSLDGASRSSSEAAFNPE